MRIRLLARFKKNRLHKLLNKYRLEDNVSFWPHLHIIIRYYYANEPSQYDMAFCFQQDGSQTRYLTIRELTSLCYDKDIYSKSISQLMGYYQEHATINTCYNIGREEFYRLLVILDQLEEKQKASI